MKTLNFKKFAIATLYVLALSIAAIGCKKSSINDNANSPDPTDPGNHVIDSRFVGTWMWTKGSDGAYYDGNGTYIGSAYGFAMQYTIHADGTGTAFNHVFSTIGVGTGVEVNISSKGFFESDNDGHMGYFPLSGTYKSTSQNRVLAGDELWNVSSGTGRSYVYQKVVFTTQGGRECFQVTSTSGVTDTFFKIK